jgi:IMP cyclohydrolase
MKRNPYIAYNCIRVSKNGVVVSNGSHTDPIFEMLEQGTSPEEALRHVLTDMGYERDEYNTPRIAGIVTDTIGFLGIARIDAVEVGQYPLADGMCGVICTYEMNQLDCKQYPFTARDADDAARYVVSDGIFADLEKPICASAWMGELAVYNPHE